MVSNETANYTTVNFKQNKTPHTANASVRFNFNSHRKLICALASMKSIVALLLGVASAWNKEYTMEELHSMDTLTTIKAWCDAFGRSYGDLEEASAKYLTWLDNLYVIAETNSQGLS